MTSFFSAVIIGLFQGLFLDVLLKYVSLLNPKHLDEVMIVFFGRSQYRFFPGAVSVQLTASFSLSFWLSC